MSVKNDLPTVSRADYERLIARVEVHEARMQAHFAALSVLAVALESKTHRDLGGTTALLSQYRDKYLVNSFAEDPKVACSSAAIAQEIDAILKVLATVRRPSLRVVEGGIQ